MVDHWNRQPFNHYSSGGVIFDFNVLTVVRASYIWAYLCEWNKLTVFLYEKAREDASFDMALKQEIKKAMVRHEKDAHLNNKKKKLIKKTT